MRSLFNVFAALVPPDQRDQLNTRLGSGKQFDDVRLLESGWIVATALLPHSRLEAVTYAIEHNLVDHICG